MSQGEVSQGEVSQGEVSQGKVSQGEVSNFHHRVQQTIVQQRNRNRLQSWPIYQLLSEHYDYKRVVMKDKLAFAYHAMLKLSL